MDNDGRLDLVVNAVNSKAFILKNKSPQKNYLTISLKGDGQNSHGIGSKVYLFNGGSTQYQQLMTTRGFQSSSDPRLHFGVDSLTTIDSVLIVWPDQRYQVISQVKCNQQLNVSQNDASGIFKTTDNFKPANYIVERDAAAQPITWKHK